MDDLSGIKRTHMCASLRKENIDEGVALMGWVNTRRDHGGVIFIDLRDISGIVQVVFNPELSPETHKKAHSLRNEYVLAVKGYVRSRPEDMENPNLPTGEIEVVAEELRILNSSLTPPFPVEDRIEAGENIRLKYRYIDLRREELKQRVITRHRTVKAVREYLNGHGFLEIETPFLAKSTPEGARDYLVPSRIYPGAFYALPQSPQLFKQILMISGLDRYYQIVRCFRDEDLRADRQPEFTQVDIEMSFITQEDLFEICEGMIAAVFKEGVGKEIRTPFPRLKYDECINIYGMDKPDLRFGMELRDLSDLVSTCEFRVFSDAVSQGGVVKSLNAKGANDLSRKDIDELTDFVHEFGAKGLAWARITGEDWQSPISKFLKPDEKKGIEERLNAEPGDIIFFGAGDRKTVHASLGNLRLELARRLGLIKPEEFRFAWITEFPLLEWSEGEGRYVSMHHPFTLPFLEDLDKIESDPSGVRANAYDIVLNGIEIGGGSLRIHRPDIQKRVFARLGIPEDEAEAKFGFLLEAMKYGAPPHGGIAFGLDRLVMLITGASSIRECIAFPKTQRAVCPLTGSPSEVSPEQLLGLSIRIVK